MSYNDIMRQDKENTKKLFKLSLDFFTEKGLVGQSIIELNKGIRRLKQRISEHEEKIKNPAGVYKDWDSTPEHIRVGKVLHWKKELATFEKGIQNRLNRIKELTNDEK